MYSINPLYLSRCFALPCEITDEKMKLAGAKQLRCILWLFRHCAEPVGIFEMSTSLGMSPGDIQDAMKYWTDCGIARESDGEIIIPLNGREGTRSAAPAAEADGGVKPKAKPAVKSGGKRILPDLPVVKPTREEIAKRGEEVAQLREMFSEIQKITGSTLSYDAQATLLMLFDYYGLPCDVILMLAEYAKSCGRCNMGFIRSEAKRWAENGIDTFELATKHISEAEKLRGDWNKFTEKTGLGIPKPTPNQEKAFAVWTGEMNFPVEIICEAYYETVDRCGKFSLPYMNSILTRWNKENIRTIADINKNKAAFSQDTDPERKQSYDIGKAEADLYTVPEIPD